MSSNSKNKKTMESRKKENLDSNAHNVSIRDQFFTINEIIDLNKKELEDVISSSYLINVGRCESKDNAGRILRQLSFFGFDKILINNKTEDSLDDKGVIQLHSTDSEYYCDFEEKDDCLQTNREALYTSDEDKGENLCKWLPLTEPEINTFTIINNRRVLVFLNCDEKYFATNYSNDYTLIPLTIVKNGKIKWLKNGWLREIILFFNKVENPRKENIESFLKIFGFKTNVLSKEYRKKFIISLNLEEGFLRSQTAGKIKKFISSIGLSQQDIASLDVLQLKHIIYSLGLDINREYGLLTKSISLSINSQQKLIFSLGFGNNDEYGDITQIDGFIILDAQKLDAQKLLVASLSLGSNKKYGNISFKELKDFDSEVLLLLSLGRGNSKKYGNIESFLNSKLSYNAAQLKVISLGLDCDNFLYGNVEQIKNIHFFNGNELRALSLTLGCDQRYREITNIKEIKYICDLPKDSNFEWVQNIKKQLKINAKKMLILSLGKGTNENYLDITTTHDQKGCTKSTRNLFNWSSEEMISVSRGLGVNLGNKNKQLFDTSDFLFTGKYDNETTSKEVLYHLDRNSRTKHITLDDLEVYGVKELHVIYNNEILTHYSPPIYQLKNYSAEKIELLLLTLDDKSNNRHGSIEDLNPLDYSVEQMEAISLWRWEKESLSNKQNHNIVPSEYSGEQMKEIYKGRKKDMSYSKIVEQLISKDWTARNIEALYLYGKIDTIKACFNNLDNNLSTQALKSILLGLDNDNKKYGNIMRHFDLNFPTSNQIITKKYDSDQIIISSLCLGDVDNYKCINCDHRQGLYIEEPIIKNGTIDIIKDNVMVGLDEEWAKYVVIISNGEKEKWEKIHLTNSQRKKVKELITQKSIKSIFSSSCCRSFANQVWERVELTEKQKRIIIQSNNSSNMSFAPISIVKIVDRNQIPCDYLDPSKYDAEAMEVISLCRARSLYKGNNGCFISKPNDYTAKQMRAIAKGNGCDKNYGKINHLVAKSKNIQEKWAYSGEQMKAISLSRGKDKKYGQLKNLLVQENTIINADSEYYDLSVSDVIIDDSHKNSDKNFIITNEFTAEQIKMISFCAGDHQSYGCITNLKFLKNITAEQMKIISLGRGTNKQYGNIDDIINKPNIEKYNHEIMLVISLGRGSNKQYGNVDDISPEKYDAQKMRIISIGRGRLKVYGNIYDSKKEKQDLSRYQNDQLEILLLAKGDYLDYKSIDDLDPKKFSAKTMKWVTFMRGINNIYGEVKTYLSKSDELFEYLIEQEEEFLKSIEKVHLEKNLNNLHLVVKKNINGMEIEPSSEKLYEPNLIRGYFNSTYLDVHNSVKNADKNLLTNDPAVRSLEFIRTIEPQKLYALSLSFGDKSFYMKQKPWLYRKWNEKRAKGGYDSNHAEGRKRYGCISDLKLTSYNGDQMQMISLSRGEKTSVLSQRIWTKAYNMVPFLRKRDVPKRKAPPLESFNVTIENDEWRFYEKQNNRFKPLENSNSNYSFWKIILRPFNSKKHNLILDPVLSNYNLNEIKFLKKTYLNHFEKNLKTNENNRKACFLLMKNESIEYCIRVMIKENVDFDFSKKNKQMTTKEIIEFCWTNTSMFSCESYARVKTTEDLSMIKDDIEEQIEFVGATSNKNREENEIYILKERRDKEISARALGSIEKTIREKQLLITDATRPKKELDFAKLNQYDIANYDAKKILMLSLGASNHKENVYGDIRNLIDNKEIEYCLQDYNFNQLKILSLGSSSTNRYLKIVNKENILYWATLKPLLSNDTKGTIDSNYKVSNFGDITDLSPKIFDERRMKICSLARGDNLDYGKIKQWEPYLYGFNNDCLLLISYSRSNKGSYGLIEDLIDYYFCLSYPQEHALIDVFERRKNSIIESTNRQIDSLQTLSDLFKSGWKCNIHKKRFATPWKQSQIIRRGVGELENLMNDFLENDKVKTSRDALDVKFNHKMVIYKWKKFLNWVKKSHIPGRISINKMNNIIDTLNIYIDEFKKIICMSNREPSIDAINTNDWAEKMEALSLSRGHDNIYGNIDDIIIDKHLNAEKIKIISLGRGEQEKYGNVDDFISKARKKVIGICPEYDAEKLKIISLSRGANIKYGDINEDEMNYDARTLRLISLGRGKQIDIEKEEPIAFSKLSSEERIQKTYIDDIFPIKRNLYEIENKFRWKIIKYAKLNNYTSNYKEDAITSLVKANNSLYALPKQIWKYKDIKQLEIVSLGLGEKNTYYGDVSDLDPMEYTADQMRIVSLGRGYSNWGSGISNDVKNKIDFGSDKNNDIRDEYGDNGDFELVLSNNTSIAKKHGNIDDLDPKKYSANQMLIVSISRGFYDLDIYSGNCNIESYSPKDYDWEEMLSILEELKEQAIASHQSLDRAPQPRFIFKKRITTIREEE